MEIYLLAALERRRRQQRKSKKAALRHLAFIRFQASKDPRLARRKWDRVCYKEKATNARRIMMDGRNAVGVLNLRIMPLLSGSSPRYQPSLYFFIEEEIGSGKLSLLKWMKRQQSQFVIYIPKPVDFGKNWNGSNYLDLFYKIPKPFANAFQKLC